MPESSDPKGSRQNRVEDITAYITANYHIPALLAIVGFMFWTRMISYDRFTGNGEFYLAAIDSYYHWRSTIYVVENWPNTMPYEVWTSFPTGQRVGQFGTAFDQLIATIAMIVGLGNPSESTVVTVVLIAIPLMGALVAIPAYLIGHRLGGRIAGIGGAVLLALFPGSFFVRSTVGQHQHHVAEVLFMVITVFAFMVALRVAEREKPVFELVVDRDITGLRSTLITSTLAGFALTLYMWMWSPGILMIGIIGVFFIIYLPLEHLSGRSPEHLAFVGVISMLVAGVLFLGTIEEISTSETGFGYLHTLLALGVAAGCVFMAWLSRQFDTRNIDELVYPGAVLASVIIALGLMWLLLPDIYNSLMGNVQGRLTPFGAGITAETVQEARPPADFTQHVFNEFGLAFYTALVGMAAMVISPLLGRNGRAEHGLILVWALFIISMNTAQVRFTYYLAVPVAVLNAYLIGLVVEWVDIKQGLASLKDIEGYQIIVLATVLMILIVPLMPPVASATVVDRGGQMSPHADTFTWEESLEYLQTSTPEIGQWGGANSELDYYGTYERPEDDNFHYPDGSYGVMTWWDYGHLVTVKGERIPHSNPFQRNARSSAAFLMSQGEERGSLILDAIPTGAQIQGAETDELRDAVADRTPQEKKDEFRYIMIDDATAGSKFGAIANWNEESRGDYVEMGQTQTMTGEVVTAQQMSDDYYESMVGQLYYGQANGMEQYRMIHESSTLSTMASVGIADESDQLQPFMTNVEVSAIIQNLRELGIPVTSLQDVIAHPSLELYDLHQVPEVRTFERVEGASITGIAVDENASTVQASLVLNTTTTEQPFTYTQTVDVDDDGSFSLTVPYATNNELGVEDGYTDSDVFAEDDYSVTVFDENGTVVEEGDVAVPEPGIYEGDTYEVTLELVEDEDENGETDEEENGDTDEETETNDEETDENGETETNDEEADNTTDTNSTAAQPLISAIA